MKLVDENELIQWPEKGDPKTPWQAILYADLMEHVADCEFCSNNIQCPDPIVICLLEELKKTFSIGS